MDSIFDATKKHLQFSEIQHCANEYKANRNERKIVTLVVLTCGNLSRL